MIFWQDRMVCFASSSSFARSIHPGDGYIGTCTESGSILASRATSSQP